MSPCAGSYLANRCVYIACTRAGSIRSQKVDIDVLEFRDLQQLRGFLIDICQIFQHMKRVFE
jgi:hypothetical protein